MPTATDHPAIAAIRNRLRAGQQAMADWVEGRLAVSAVPGSGKSTGMAGAAAIAIARHHLHSRRQLVVVTFTRSAAANIKAKIRAHLQELALPTGGFIVHTLHGLALNIASRHPDLSGLNLASSSLITANQSHRLIRTSVDQWIVTNPQRYQQLVEGRSFDGEEAERLRRQSVLRTEVLPDLAHTVIREAKSSGLSPEDLWQASQAVNVAEGELDYGILAIAAGLYDRYQTLLRQRNFIDYDEMILAALRVLDNPDARRFWQTQVFAVFEDEAQDSTPLQTRLLELLATDPDHPDQQNLIRVGDPNQAINSTFTPADPLFFREFCAACDRQNRLITMDQAGRSSPPIIDAANFVLNWVNQQWEQERGSARGKDNLPPPSLPPSPQHSQLSPPPPLPFRPQPIHPVPPDDPQPGANPAAEGQGVEVMTPMDIQDTVAAMAQRLLGLFARHPQAQAAVLVRTNEQGRYVARELEKWCGDRLRIFEVGQSDRQSQVPAEILALLQFIYRPHSPDYLKSALRVLVDRQLIPAQDLNALASQPEQFLYPGPLDAPVGDDRQQPAIQQARRYGRNLLRARLELPPYQLISFLALTLNYDKTELATADKLADRIARQTVSSNDFPTILAALSEIVGSEQFSPVETEDVESRYTRSGQVTVITLHKAKGLDWDYVFLPFLYAQNLPGSLWVPPQTSFLGDFTLAEVARAQIRALAHGQPIPAIAPAWEQAQQLKHAEEYRLLYVGITRAKRLLWLTAEQRAPFSWNKPDNLEEKAPCPAVAALGRSRFNQA